MDERYWDSLAGRYDEEIFNPLELDRNGTIARVIAALGSGDRAASDYGCGIGAWLPMLTEHFARVCAIEEPPGWMRDPWPWDWLVTATKRGERAT